MAKHSRGWTSSAQTGASMENLRAGWRFRVWAALAAGGVALIALGMATPAQAEYRVKPGGRGPLDRVPIGSIAFIDGDSLVLSMPTGDGGGSMGIYETVGGAPDRLLESFKA